MKEKQKERIKKLGLPEEAFEPQGEGTSKSNGKNVEERLQLVEEQLTSLSYSLKKISDSVLEVIKKDDSEMPAGDYLNPIQYEAGMKVEKDKFYTDGENIWEAIKSGKPSGFDDKSYFDIIEV